VNLREAAQQALEAMGKMYAKNMDDFMDCMTAYVNLQRALEEPEQDDTALLRRCLNVLLNACDPKADIITALRERLGEKT
jgi:hypothetical protein